MNVLYFLKQRTQFIRWYYETASEPFREIKRKIEAGEAPFVQDPFEGREDEPPFFEEWQRAERSLEVLSRGCVSMLSESLKLYFTTWESELRIQWQEGEKERYVKKGFIKGYRRCFGERLKVTWEDCPVDFDLLEQVTLVRNKDQHPDWITTMRVKHDYDTKARSRFPTLFFLSEDERVLFSTSDVPINFQPTVHVSHEQLFTALEQVEALGDWLEDRMLAAKHPRRTWA